MDTDLFMECETEELDPWQEVPWKQVDDDDAEEEDWELQDENNHSALYRIGMGCIGSGRKNRDSDPKEGEDDLVPDQDTDEEWQPNREDSGSGCSSPFQNASDSESDEAQPTTKARLPPVGSKRTKGDTESREEQPTSRSTLGSKRAKRSGGRPGVSLPAADPPEWSEKNWKPKDIPFTATPGLINGAAALVSDQPVDFLELFLTDELLLDIAVRTNSYAEQCIQIVNDGLQPHSKTNPWKAVTVPELKNFFGLLFLTGVIHKPELDMYWSTDELIATPYFNKTMSRNRFQIIWRFLHFSDTGSTDATDGLYKVRAVVDYLISKFREMFQPKENICIDEGMLLWCGRPAFKVYNPQNPVKYGLKSYFLCDSETGYCFNMKPFCGEHAALGDTVVSLLDRLAGHGYRLYIDNFDNSVALCARLIDMKTHVCGTLRKNRGEPPSIREVLNSDMVVGETIARHNGKVLVLAWQDKQMVTMVTTLHQNVMESVQEKRKGQPVRVLRQKPACVNAYNKSMYGINRLDQNIVHYPYVRKTTRWTKKFVTYLFEICMFNAFTIYKAKIPQGLYSKCFMSFILSVVKSWTSAREPEDSEEESDYSEDDSGLAPRAPYRDPTCRLNAKFKGHELVRLPPTLKKQHPSKRCRACSKRKLRKETRFYCKGCKIPLCKGECFTKYHS